MQDGTAKRSRNVNLGENGKFLPGNRANPSGRPPKSQEEYDLEAACKAKTPEALQVILRLMQKAETDKTKLAAAQYVIDRAFGKARETTALKVSGEIGFTSIERVIVHAPELRMPLNKKSAKVLTPSAPIQ